MRRSGRDAVIDRLMNKLGLGHLKFMRKHLLELSV